MQRTSSALGASPDLRTTSLRAPDLQASPARIGTLKWASSAAARTELRTGPSRICTLQWSRAGGSRALLRSSATRVGTLKRVVALLGALVLLLLLLVLLILLLISVVLGEGDAGPKGSHCRN